MDENKHVLEKNTKYVTNYWIETLKTDQVLPLNGKSLLFVEMYETQITMTTVKIYIGSDLQLNILIQDQFAFGFGLGKAFEAAKQFINDLQLEPYRQIAKPIGESNENKNFSHEVINLADELLTLSIINTNKTFDIDKYDLMDFVDDNEEENWFSLFQNLSSQYLIKHSNIEFFKFVIYAEKHGKIFVDLLKDQLKNQFRIHEKIIEEMELLTYTPNKDPLHEVFSYELGSIKYCNKQDMLITINGGDIIRYDESEVLPLNTVKIGEYNVTPSDTGVFTIYIMEMISMKTSNLIESFQFYCPFVYVGDIIRIKTNISVEGNLSITIIHEESGFTENYKTITKVFNYII